MSLPDFRAAVSIFALASAFAVTGAACGQDGIDIAPATVADVAAFGDEIVVTAAPGDKTKLRSAISVTDIASEQVAALAPRSEAEILKLLPGIRVESTAGPGGNANITVRGLPLASGGSKYVQIQEDGAPVVEFGDIAFGNNDYWTRHDWTVDTVQAVRGSSSTTLASQAPGAVINYISRTGQVAGGEIGVTTGLGHDAKRLDFNYGAPVSERLRFNVGGFYRRGEGPRDVPYRAMDGYQVKANVTREFAGDRGFLRLYLKRLDDRAPTYHNGPFAVRVKGRTITGYDPLPGFDPRKGPGFSADNLTFPTIHADGTMRNGSNRYGISVQSTSLGAQLHYAASDSLTMENRLSWTENEGRFSAPFYGQLMRLQSLLDSYAVTTSDGRTYRAASARFATGPRTGEAVSGATVIDMNPNLYTDMKDMGRLGNDLALSRRFAIGRAKVVARAGWYYSRQKIAMDWHWNQSIKTALTDPARIDLFAADGTRLTDAGLTGYNNQWGACCARTYDLTYTDHAPYLLLNYIDDRLDISGSVRRDEIRARGTFRGTAPGPVALDVNGDGQLSVAERNVYRTSSAVTQRIAYDVGYTSWTLGANYLVTTDLAVFVRVSHGYRANADRVVSGDYGTLLMADGGLAPGGRRAVVNPVTQQGIGLKARGDFAGGRFGVNATLFRAQATEFNYDLTRAEGERITFQRYKADGFELEAQFAKGGFSLHGNLTHTHSKIARDLIGGNRGNRPRATPAWTWSVAPAYDFGVLALGMTMVGHSSSYPSDDNRLRQRGQNLFSAFVRVEPVEGLELSLNANNLFNAWDQSGRLDQGSVADLAETGALFGVPYAATNRVGLGRTVSGSVKYSF